MAVNLIRRVQKSHGTLERKNRKKKIAKYSMLTRACVT